MPMSSSTPVKADVSLAAEVEAGLTAFESEIVAVFVDLMQLLGLPKSYGEIYGLLYASADALTFAQIEQKLDLSKGSISQGLRALRELGAVMAQAAPSGVAAREVFSPQIELRRLVSALLKERLVPYLRSGEKRVAVIEAMLTEVEGGESVAETPRQRTLHTRAQKLKTWQKRSSAVLPLVAKFLG